RGERHHRKRSPDKRKLAVVAMPQARREPRRERNGEDQPDERQRPLPGQRRALEACRLRAGGDNDRQPRGRWQNGSARWHRRSPRLQKSSLRIAREDGRKRPLEQGPIPCAPWRGHGIWVLLEFTPAKPGAGTTGGSALIYV